jgi:serine/threonine-protein kinase
MPPEQARGAWNQVGPAADVYSMGAVLYKLLSGRTPFRGEDAQEVLDKVLAGPPKPIEDARTGPPIPEGLTEICERAMAREIQDRYPDGGALAAAVEAWLDGSMRRQRALLRVGEAKGLLPRAEELRRQALDLQSGALGALESVRGHDPVTDKHAGWALEDQAGQARARAALLELDARRALHDALNLDPELPEAHEALANIYREMMSQSEEERDWQRAGQWERMLRDHDRGEHAEFLEGQGRLSIQTEPAGAEAVVYRYVEQGRRLRAERVRSLGTTPVAVRLPMGDYLVVLHKEGHESVRYPVSIEREGRWNSLGPGQDTVTSLVLPIQGSLDPRDCHVPGGWFTAGGDPLAPSALARERLWVDSFVMRRDPVTNEEYCAFLNALIDAGEGEQAQRCAPRFENFPLLKMEGAHYSCRTDLSMFDASPDKPVVLVDWLSAKAYAAWVAKESGLPWRLPFELEWEKAARGVDARCFPWGNFLDPTWCNMRESQPERPAVASPGDFPADESPYGLRGLAGNVTAWCEDLYRKVGPVVLAGHVSVQEQPGEGPRSLRGGHFHGVGEISRAAHRYRLDPSYRGTMIGVRLVRPCP